MAEQIGGGRTQGEHSVTQDAAVGEVGQDAYLVRQRITGWQSISQLFGTHSQEARIALKNIAVEAADSIVGKNRDFPDHKAIGRFAPAVTLRSECELFGQSIPRFAARIYLDDTHHSFANFRRIGELFDRLGDTSFVALPKSGMDLHKYELIQNNEVIRDAMRSKDWHAAHVAEAMIIPNQTLRDDFVILTTEMGREYGEGVRIAGAPYSSQFPGIGGGTCAQAVVHMACVLLLGMKFQKLEEWPRVSVHGPGEITVLASSNLDLVRLRGLRMRGIKRYFQRTERQYLVQGNMRQRFISKEAHQRTNLLDATLLAYLRCGVPVILPVNFERFRTKQNDLPAVHFDPPDHAVLVVGYSKDRQGQTTYLINDPNRPPFQRYESNYLWEASKTHDTWEADDVGREIGVPLPKSVQLSVETPICEVPNAQIVPGLLDLAVLLQTNQEGDAPAITGLELEDESDYNPGDLALSRVTPKPFDAICEAGVLPPGCESDTALEATVDEKLAGRSGHWCYLQARVTGIPPECQESLWVWDAERCYPDDGNVRNRRKSALRQLMAVFWNSDRGWCGFVPGECPPAPQALVRDPQFEKAARNLLLDTVTAGSEKLNTLLPAPPCGLSKPAISRLIQPAIITSLSTLGTKAALDELARDPAISAMPLDLFMFMHREPLVRDTLGDIPILDALSELSLHRNATLRKKLAEAIIKLTPNHDIRAAASFLPEIVASDPNLRSKGVSACVGVIKLAIELNAQGKHLRAIELVCGSRLGGIGRAKHKAKDRIDYFAIIRNDEELTRLLAQSLRAIVVDSQIAEIDRSHSPLMIALEVEPGPLNALNHREMMKTLAEALRQNECRNIVGWNLDVSHFQLAQMNPSDFAAGSPDRQLLRDRVVHAHVSDHGRGVFGDVSLSTQYRGAPECNRRWIQQWLDLLSQIANERLRPPPESLPFSNTLSLELEAVRNEQMIVESLAELS